jgi:hypothetical protein
VPIIRAINILSLFYEDKKKCLETADKLWFGIGKEQEFSLQNLLIELWNIQILIGTSKEARSVIVNLIPLVVVYPKFVVCQ